MSKPTVSILTTCFNREKYLAACIESVLASSYQDWELIIVDDVSTDTSVAIAQRYEKKDARIKVYVNRTKTWEITPTVTKRHLMPRASI